MYYLRISLKFIVLIALLVYATGCKDGVFEPADLGEIEVSFQQHLVPIMNESCVGCHQAADDPPPILDPDLAYSNIIGGGYVVPGNAEESLLYKRLIGDPDIKGGRTMPPREKLPESEIQLFKEWIEQGVQNN